MLPNARLRPSSRTLASPTEPRTRKGLRHANRLLITLPVGLLKARETVQHNRGPLRLQIMSAGSRPELKEGLGLNTSPKISAKP